MIRPQLENFMRQIGKDAIAIIPAAHETTRSYDTEHKFRQDSDFYYLTGYLEPDAVAVITPANRKKPFTLFVRPRDPLMETWYGRREGVDGAKEKYGASRAFPIEKLAAELPKLLNGHEKLYYRFGVDRKLDETILNYLSGQRFKRLKTAYPPHTIIDPTMLIHEERLHKTQSEVELMQKAADIASEAHVLAMQKTRPGINESQIEAVIEHHFRMSGATCAAYNSIIGGGENATILHYVENNQSLKDGDLLLVDAGAEYQGYASDITRTFPVNGKFTKPQREIYDAVLDVQIKCVEATKTGTTVKERQDLSIQLLTEKMLELGLLTGKPEEIIKNKTYEKFYMHGVGHYLGLDVHDAGRYFVDQRAKDSRPFEPGMVLTVEPGLYIAPDAEDVPDKYRGIGVRIEDDVLVAAEGNLNLTAKCPKHAEEIEDLMAKAKK